MGYWFGKKKWGLIMGIWNVYIFIGNILGFLIVFFVFKFGWGWFFIIFGIILVGGGFLVWLFFVVDFYDVGLFLFNEIEVVVEGEKK